MAMMMWGFGLLCGKNDKKNQLDEETEIFFQQVQKGFLNVDVIIKVLIN
jgi:hypothetical protein